MIYLFVILGALLSLFERYLSGYLKPDFTWKEFIKRNLPLSLFNMVAGITIVAAITISNPDFVVHAGTADVTIIVFAVVGYIGHYAFKLIVAAVTALIKKLTSNVDVLKPKL